MLSPAYAGAGAFDVQDARMQGEHMDVRTCPGIRSCVIDVHLQHGWAWQSKAGGPNIQNVFPGRRVGEPGTHAG